MNKHLNIYKTYTKVNRKNGELEDDLTRALAIVLQENDVGYFGISPKKYYYGNRSIENPSKHDSLD